MSNKLLQYVVLRKDILPSKKASGSFSMGACIAQACHAATAAVISTYSQQDTQRYIDALADMTVCVLGTEDGDSLSALSESLRGQDIKFHLWIEQPENIPTALATAPIRKEIATPVLGHLKLLRYILFLC